LPEPNDNLNWQFDPWAITPLWRCMNQEGGKNQGVWVIDLANALNPRLWPRFVRTPPDGTANSNGSDH